MNWPFAIGISILVLLTLGISIGTQFFKSFNTDNSLNLYEENDILKNNNSTNNKIIPINDKLGIFVDFENCPNFYFEFLILKAIIQDFSNNLPNLFYDEEHYTNSSIITIGNNNNIDKDKKHDIILIKYKLLKDILYNQVTFDKILDIIKSYIEVKFNITLLDYNFINFKNYKEKYIDIQKKMDKKNIYSINCIDSLRLKKSFFIKIDYNKIERFFINKDVIEIYKLYLKRIVSFITIAIEGMTGLENIEDEESYKILITFRTNSSNYGLSPRRIILTENKKLKISNIKEFVINLIISIKHKILHSLGFPHFYFFDSIMNNLENNKQRNNLFYFFKHDIDMLHMCYEKSNNTKNNFAFLGNNNNFNKSESELILFLNNYDMFLKQYI